MPWTWTTPRTWADNELVTASLLNTHLRDNLNALNEVKSPVGSVSIYAGATAPTGWLLCDGSAVSRTTYAALFAVTSTTYGVGDGSTTFNLPDLRGRFALGKDNMGGISANRVTATQADNLGQGSGSETHTLVTAELPAHDHAMWSGPFKVGSGANPGNWLFGPQADQFSGDATKPRTDNNGSGAAHNNMSPYLTLNFIIKF